MTSYRSDFLKILSERGFLHQLSAPEQIDALAEKRALVAYVGYDCTAPSLHVGNLTTIMMLYWLQQTGNKPLTLIGGGTTRVGDPSGKNETRELRRVEEIDGNKASIQKVFEKILRYGDGPADCRMVDNAEWLLDLKWIDMLRDVGRHFSVNRMLAMESVKLRLERALEMSFLEFNYMICQAYDFVELARRYGCNLQMGGSDQWGNIVTGADLGRRKGFTLSALTAPLLTNAAGEKMGKTAAGAIWLNPDMLSPYDFWQYFRNVDDADVGPLLYRFTTLPPSEIKRIESLQGAERNEAKKILATETTAFIHGRAEAEKAAQAARDLFEAKMTSADMPTRLLPQAEWDNGISVLSAFVSAGLLPSKSEVRRQIRNGGLSVNDERLSDENARISSADKNADGGVKLSFGKKKHVLITSS